MKIIDSFRGFVSIIISIIILSCPVEAQIHCPGHGRSLRLVLHFQGIKAYFRVVLRSALRFMAGLIIVLGLSYRVVFQDKPMPCHSTS